MPTAPDSTVKPQVAFAQRVLDPALQRFSPPVEKLPDGRIVAVITRIDIGLIVMGCPDLVVLLSNAAGALRSCGELTLEQRSIVLQLDGWLRAVQPLTSEILDATPVH